ncbi:MAG: S26 family signal peptidase [Mycobacteriales bacterium]
MRWRWFFAVVAGESMAPRLRDGDRVVARRARRPCRPRIGTVVVAAHPQQPELLIVKRLSAGPGDSAYGAPLGTDEYWLSSDNLLVAPDDSRNFGPVASAAIVGRVVLRYWPAPAGIGEATSS